MTDNHTCHKLCIPLPSAVSELKTAQQKVAKHWEQTALLFTLDGRLLGDIAEAIVAEHFDLRFPHQLEPPKRRTKGIDLWTKDGESSVQVKCSAIGKGPAYSSGEKFADRLIFGLLRFDSDCFEIIYDGPEHHIRAPLGKISGTKRVGLRQVQEWQNKQLNWE
jgi:hypothetical protein